MNKTNVYWKYLKASLLVIFLSATGFSQKAPKVTLEQLKETEHEEYDADVKYIFSNCRVTLNDQMDGLNLMVKVHHRIKIYNDEGLDYADFDIPLYHSEGGQREKIMKIKAKTYNAELGGVISEIKLDKKSIFEEKGENWNHKKFAMPGVKPGSIVDVEYTVLSPFFYQLPDWNFQREVPVEYSSYKINLNQYFSYRPIAKGMFPIQSEDPLGQQQEGEYAFFAENIPPFEDDEFVLNADDYRSSIRCELYSIDIPGVYSKNYSTDWNNICQNLRESDRFGREMSRNRKEYDYILDETDDLEGLERAKAIYNYVRDNFTWNGKIGKYCQKGLKKMAEEYAGNSADLNLLLINLLRKADFDAFPVLTKSRNSGVFNSGYASAVELNYVFAMVEIDEQKFYLDASSKHSIFGALPKRALNISGIEMRDNRTDVVYFINPNVYKFVKSGNFKFNEDFTELTGEGVQKYMAYAAKEFRDDLEKEDEEPEESESGEDESEEEDDGLKDDFEVIEVSGVGDIESSINVDFEQVIRKDILHIKDQILIDADLNMGIEENPFYSETREFPVFYSHLTDIRYVSNIVLPEDLAVESIPEPMVYQMRDNIGTFLFDVKNVGQLIIINYAFKINKDIILPEDYPDLKAMYEHAVSKGTEKIVLKKL